jgi:hypothetical protein
MQADPQAISYPCEVQYVQQRTPLQIPYDEAPFEADLPPGQQIRLYGGIEVRNDTATLTKVRVQFHLPGGFVLTVEDPYSSSSFEKSVSMHKQYAIKPSQEGWYLVEEKLLAQNE